MSNAYDEDGKYKPNLNGELDEDGDRIWTNSEGEYHREDGPAIEWSDGVKSWYIDDKNFTKDEWLQWLKEGKSSLDQKTLNRIILENS
jgi:hypothetical protein